MNRFAFICLFICCSNYSSAQTSNYNQVQSAKSNKGFKISGIIKNFNSSTDNRFIELRTYDINNYLGNQKTSSIIIDSNGHFSAVLTQPFESDFEFGYNKEYIPLYYLHGASLFLKLDKVKWKSNKSKAEALSITGKSAGMIKLMLNFKHSYQQQRFKTVVDWSDITKIDSTVASNRIKKMHEELNFAYNYFRANNITHPFFKNWVINDIKYKAGWEIVWEPFANGKRRAITHKPLMSLLKEIDFNNSQGIHNSSYYSFIAMVSGAVQIMLNINPMYKSEIRENGMNPVPVYLRIVDTYARGFTRQLMYYYTYIGNHRKYALEYFNRFNAGISNGYLRSLFPGKSDLDLPFVQFDLLKKIKDFNIDETIKTRLINIIEGEKDNYVFIDFWGDWCSPCMKEMPFYKQFIEAFQGKNISFIFFGVNTDEKSSSKVKDQFDISGKFITLNDDETHLMNNLLQFNSYPKHFIIAPGFIVLNKILRVTTGGERLDENVVKEIMGYMSKQ
jgi:thiol-disulfide isomerase/thioredoxin